MAHLATKPDGGQYVSLTEREARGFQNCAAACLAHHEHEDRRERIAVLLDTWLAAGWAYLCTATRGFAMVTLVSMNTRQIATGHISAAVVIGFLISLLWYQNSSKDRDNRRGAGVAYAAGAALGTYTGFMLAAWLAG